MLAPELASQQITGGGTHGNGQIKNAENAAAFVFRKKVGDKSRRNGHERRLADAHQGMAKQQFPVGVSDRRQQGSVRSRKQRPGR